MQAICCASQSRSSLCYSVSVRDSVCAADCDKAMLSYLAEEKRAAATKEGAAALIAEAWQRPSFMSLPCKVLNY